LLENIAKKEINEKLSTLLPSYNVCDKNPCFFIISSWIIKCAYAKSIIKISYNKKKNLLTTSIFVQEKNKINKNLTKSNW